MGAWEPVTAVIAGLVVFGESIPLTGFIAIAMIITAVMIVICSKAEAEKIIVSGVEKIMEKNYAASI